MSEPETERPVLAQVKNGWAAYGKGWAVHGRTPDEALEKFGDAQRRRREILKMPYWYEQQAQADQEPEGGKAEK